MSARFFLMGRTCRRSNRPPRRFAGRRQHHFRHHAASRTHDRAADPASRRRLVRPADHYHARQRRRRSFPDPVRPPAGRVSDGGRPARHVEDLRGLGAEQTVESIELAEGPFSLITESVGGESLAYAIERVASGGTVVMFGSSGGELTPIGFRQSGSRGRAASDRVLCLSSENWRGYHLATRAGRGRPARNARSPDRIVAGAQALDALRQRSISGKAVLTMAE
jgi:hypothetical protein